DLVVLALVVDRPDAIGPRVLPGRAVVEHGIVGPAVPQRLDDSHELLAAGIAIGVSHLAVTAIVARRRREPRRHDVPAGTAAAHMVDRSELTRQVERLGIGGRRGGDQPDPVRAGRERRQHGDRLEPAAARAFDIAVERELVGEENRIEQPGFGALRHVLEVADVGQRPRRRLGMAPRRLVMPAAVDEQVEMHPAGHRAIASLCCTSALPNALNSARLIGLVCGSYSACHCTPTASAGASAMRIASIVPSSAMPSRITRLPGSRIPWPCSEFTRIAGQPSTRANQPFSASFTSWRSANTTFGSGWMSPFSSRGARWFMRPGISRISGCRVPPNATFISCRPRQMPNKGTPRSTQARTSASAMASRSWS